VSDLIPIESTNLDRIDQATAELAADSISEATKLAYHGDWTRFCAWLDTSDPLPISPEVVARYVRALSDAGAKPSTIRRAIASISVAHQVAGHESPCQTKLVRAVIGGAVRRAGLDGRARGAKPLTVGTLRSVISEVDGSAPPKSIRDKALLLLGWSIAARRSELVGLNLGDLDVGERGLTVTIMKSKTAQHEAIEVPVPMARDASMCAVHAVSAWVELLHTEDPESPLFRSVARGGGIASHRLSDRAVDLIVKQRCGADYSAHSLRAGYVTSAAEAGEPSHAIMVVSRHRSHAMVAHYSRAADAWRSVPRLV